MARSSSPSAVARHVLLTFEEYQRLASSKESIVECLGLPLGIEDVELEIPPLRDLARAADLRWR